jgi:DHA3 family macrolide efflux protein-like MFS transporter
MKNVQALTLLFIANTISGFAQGISMLAIPWYFTSIIKRPDIFGVMYAVVTVLTIFWSLFSGTLIDRYPRKNIFLLINVCGFLILGSVAFTGFTLGEVPLALVILVFSVTMFIYNIHYPTLYAFGQELTEKRNYRKVNSYIEIIGQSTNMLAGGIAAILLTGISPDKALNFLGFKLKLPFSVEQWKLHEIFLLDASTYVIAITLIAFIKYTPTEILEIDRDSIQERLKKGFRFLKEHQSLFIFGVGSYAVFAVLLVQIHMLVPMYVENHLQEGSDVYASTEIFYTMGALFVGLIFGRLMKSLNEVKAILAKMFLTFIVMMIAAFTKVVGLFFAVYFIMGITNSGTRILRITYLFDHIPNNIIGRANSVLHVINILMRFSLIAAFSLPFFTTGNNVTWAYFACGIFVLIFTVPLLLNFRKLVASRA